MTALVNSAPVEGVDWRDPFLVVARVSLFVAIINAHTRPWLLVVVAVVTGLVFFQERLLRAGWPWLVLGALYGASQIAEWWTVDDHTVATTYWLLAIGVSRFASRPHDVLAVSARAMIGLLFAFAFAWKLLSSQYTSGDFFEYTLLRDHRFEPVAVIVGGADPDVLEASRARVSGFTDGARFEDSIDVETGPRVRVVAAAFTWFGLLIEGTIALVFLAPLRGAWRWSRPAALVTFCLTTYGIVPVVGFGLLLMTMGAAQAPDDRVRRAYLGAAVLVFVWNSVLAGFII